MLPDTAKIYSKAAK